MLPNFASARLYLSIFWCQVSTLFVYLPAQCWQIVFLFCPKFLVVFCGKAGLIRATPVLLEAPNSSSYIPMCEFPKPPSSTITTVENAHQAEGCEQYQCLYVHIYLFGGFFIYLGLSCSMWDLFSVFGVQTLSCSMWDLVPWLGIELGAPVLGAQSLSHWTTREVP